MGGERKASRNAKRRQRLGAWKPQARVRRSSQREIHDGLRTGDVEDAARIAEVPRIAAVDLFCGAGGLTRGLENVGIEVRLGVDLDKRCEFPYTRNNTHDPPQQDRPHPFSRIDHTFGTLDAVVIWLGGASISEAFDEF